MNSRIRRTLYISFKSWLCCCSLPSVAPQQLLWKANLHEMYSHKAGTWKCWILPPFVVRTWGNSRIFFTRLLCSNDFNKSPPFLTPAIKLCIIHYFTSNRMTVYWNTDFYSSHVIPLNETISNYFINWLLPSLFANPKVTHLYLATGKLNTMF